MAEEPVLGPDRVELMAELARLAFEVSQLASPLDDARFHWRPTDGRWSVGQCVDHLVRANRVYLDALEEAVRRALDEGACPAPALQPGRLGRWFLGTLEPSSTIVKFKAPKKIEPAAHPPRQATLVAFAGEQQRVIELVRASACVDCNQAKFENPLAYGLRVFNVATGLLVIPAHERRHLAQARRVVEHPDFPAAS